MRVGSAELLDQSIFYNIFEWLRVLDTWRGLEYGKSDKQISIDVEKNHKTWIS